MNCHIKKMCMILVLCFSMPIGCMEKKEKLKGVENKTLAEESKQLNAVCKKQRNLKIFLQLLPDGKKLDDFRPSPENVEMAKLDAKALIYKKAKELREAYEIDNKLIIHRDEEKKKIVKIAVN